MMGFLYDKDNIEVVAVAADSHPNIENEEQTEFKPSKNPCLREEWYYINKYIYRK